jgi:hypothetical protein
MHLQRTRDCAQAFLEINRWQRKDRRVCDYECKYQWKPVSGLLLIDLWSGVQDYVRQMIRVFNDAEDMESLDDLHSLCTMMSTIREFLQQH